MLEATPHRRSRPAGAAAAPSAIGTSIEHKVRLSLLPSMATSTLTAYATKQAGDVERGYSNGDVTEGAAVVPIGTTILVQQSEAQPSVLSKYQVGPAVVTESLYEQLPSLSTTSVASEVPYISLDEFLADETTSPNNQINEDKQTDLTCNVPPPPTRGQTVPYTIQPLEASKQLLPTINGCSLTSSPTSSSSSIEHEDEAMGYNPSGSVSQLSIFRRQTNNSLQLNFREDLAMVPRLSSTSPVSEVSDEDASTSLHSLGGGNRGKDNRRRCKKPVPDEKKDEIYWRRRHKNNLAAKRSREARRQKETDLTKKATILEMEHEKLKSELDDALKQNSELRMRLSKYEEL